MVDPASESTRARLTRRYAALETDRSPYMADWHGCAAMFAPDLGRFTSSDGRLSVSRSRIERYRKLIDNTPLMARRTCSAGMLSGMSSPARPWFRLQTEDPALNERKAVKRWLDDVTKVMRGLFASTNTYRSLHTHYDELATFGTTAGVVLSHPERVMHNFGVPVGTYCLATDEFGDVTTFYRKFSPTVEQAARMFGKEKLSRAAQNLIDRGSLNSTIGILHAIEPREARIIGSPWATDMPYASIYLELGADSDVDVLLNSGYQSFPVLAPRWDVPSDEVYGKSPALEALGDARQLQHETLRRGQGIDQAFNPALQAPDILAGATINRGPGSVTFVPMNQSGRGIISPLFDVSVPIREMEATAMDIRNRIREALYTNLFMMIANDQRATPATAREIAERHEEKMIMLGPVIERQHDELLSVYIERAFEYGLRANLFPPPPPEMDQAQLKVRFVSVLAQAQMLAGVGTIERFTMTLGQIATIKPEALDKLNADEAVDNLADILGVDPDMVLSNDEVAIVRDNKAKMAQAQQAAELAATAGKGARDLAAADTEGRNALTDLLSGYSLR